MSKLNKLHESMNESPASFSELAIAIERENIELRTELAAAKTDYQILMVKDERLRRDNVNAQYEVDSLEDVLGLDQEPTA